MAALCRVQTCTKPRTSRSLYCPHHASRHRRHGDPLGRAISTAELREAREIMRGVMEKYAEGRAMKAAWKIMALLFEHARQKRRSARRKSVGWGYFARAIYRGLTVDEALEIIGAVYILGWERPNTFFTDHRLNVHLGYELQRSKGLPCRESYVKGVKKNRYPNVTARQKREVGDAVREFLGKFLANVVLTRARDRKEARGLQKAIGEPLDKVS